MKPVAFSTSQGDDEEARLNQAPAWFSESLLNWIVNNMRTITTQNNKSFRDR